MMPPHNTGIAVIGSGYWGRNLVRNFHQLGVLKLICDKNEMALAQFSSQYPEVQTCIALPDVLSRKDVHGVVIATPAETHFVLAREALLAGKHVYVEKPLVLDEDQAQELISLAGRGAQILMVGHLLQYHPAFMRLKDLAFSGELGRINYIYSHRLNLGKIRREENILWSFAPHDISMILSLAGEEPETVSATGGCYLHQKIADVTTTHMGFPSGLRAHIFVSWLHPFKVQQLVVLGDRKMAVFDDTQPWPEKLLLYPHRIKWQNHQPVPTKGEAERFEVPQAEPLRLECEHFLACCSTGEPPITDGSEGLRVLKILRAAQDSMDKGCCKIDMKNEAKGYRQEAIGKQAAHRPSPMAHGLSANFFSHPTSVIDDQVAIGAGVKIWHFSHILSHSSIGDHTSIGQNVVIGPNVSVGGNCKIQNNVSVYQGVTLEDGVFCGPSMVFTNISNPRAEIGKMDQLQPTLVKRGATLGANCTIVCGTTVGRYAFVGAGAVVTRNVPDYALVVGNPARQIGWACQCGERLGKDLDCPACGKVYEQQDHGLTERLQN